MENSNIKVTSQTFRKSGNGVRESKIRVVEKPQQILNVLEANERIRELEALNQKLRENMANDNIDKTLEQNGFQKTYRSNEFEYRPTVEDIEKKYNLSKEIPSFYSDTKSAPRESRSYMFDSINAEQNRIAAKNAELEYNMAQLRAKASKTQAVIGSNGVPTIQVKNTSTPIAIQPRGAANILENTVYYIQASDVISGKLDYQLIWVLGYGFTVSANGGTYDTICYRDNTNRSRPVTKDVFDKIVTAGMSNGEFRMLYNIVPTTYTVGLSDDVEKRKEIDRALTSANTRCPVFVRRKDGLIYLD